jgi:glycosyltransferase involved in cell wall biosynthesis
MSAPLLVAVIPAYNEGERLPAFLRDWTGEALRRPGRPIVAIVVDDGSDAAHAARHREAVEHGKRVLAAAGSPHSLRFLAADRNTGKGAAIRLGWRAADSRAAWIGFVDADGAVPASEFWRLGDTLSHDDGSFDVLCGSRVKMAGRSVERSLFRHLQGRTFATIVEEMFHLGFYDTQCGLKFFRGAMVAGVLDELSEDRWLLDIEVLARLKAHGARCIEAPIDCHERGGSALVFGIDPLRMMAGLWRLKRRLARSAAGPTIEVAR